MRAQIKKIGDSWFARIYPNEIRTRGLEDGSWVEIPDLILIDITNIKEKEEEV